MIITKEQKAFLGKVVRGEWSINPDTGLVDVVGSVIMSYCNLTEIPVKFGEVTSYFNCSNNQLTSLVGAPQSVGSLFCINLSDIDKKYYHVIIPQIEEMIESGIVLENPDECYYSYKEAYYTNKLIELL
jgi:hypothetical protein